MKQQETQKDNGGTFSPLDRMKQGLNQNSKKIVKVSHTVIKRLAIVTFLVNCLLLVVVGNISQSALRGKQDAYVNEIVDNISSTIETNLAEYVAISEIIAMDPEIVTLLEKSTDKNPMANQSEISSVLSTLSGIQSKFPAILNVGVCDIEQDAYFIDDGSTSGPSFSFKTRPYYSAVTTRASMVTDPYVDVVTNTVVVTVASPVFSNTGTALGATIVDISIDFIIDLIVSSGFGETGRSLIADPEGTLIVAMDVEFIGSHYSTLGLVGDELSKALGSSSNGFISFETSGEEAFALTKLIDGTDWTLLTGMEKWEFNHDADQVNRWLMNMLVFSFAINLVVAVMTVQGALRPIDYLRTAMHELSTGNTHFEFDYESNNEIGALADDLRFTTHNLADYISEIDRQLECCGKGDFTVHSDMEFLGDFAAIQTSIHNFVLLISSALNNMKSTVEQVTLGSEYVATGSQDLAQGSNRQSDSVNILNEKIQDITHSVTENVKNVKHVNDCSLKTAQDLKTNREKMTKMVESMDEIQRTSEGINKIVKTIEDVAFQTNILALNAAVEAARAGTAGKGFAVVAEEVRNLSSRTSEAVHETTRLIEETVSAVKAGSLVVDATATELNEIIDFVESFMGSLKDITEASQHQALAIEEINSGVTNISTVMQQNSAISEQSATTSAELSSQAGVMKDTIDQFKTLATD